MSQYGYIILMCFVLLIAIVGTIAVGVSKQNKEGNPEYESGTKSNWTRLTIYYVIAGILGILAMVAFIMR